MNPIKRRIGTILLGFGFDPRRLLYTAKSVPAYLWQAIRLKSTISRVDGAPPIRLVPTLADKYLPSGVAKGHYFHQDLWAARKIYTAKPTCHVDVGSRIDGFIAHLLTFREVTVLDVRPLDSKVTGLTFATADMTQEAPANLSAPSVSCLHALEHFGLGRYGGPLDLDGWKKGLKTLAGLTQENGRLYLSVPIGRRTELEFNAQWVFDPQSIPREAQNYGLHMLDFAWVDDNGDMHEAANPSDALADFGCGCYVFTKRLQTPREHHYSPPSQRE